MNDKIARDRERYAALAALAKERKEEEQARQPRYCACGCGLLVTEPGSTPVPPRPDPTPEPDQWARVSEPWVQLNTWNDITFNPAMAPPRVSTSEASRIARQAQERIIRDRERRGVRVRPGRSVHGGPPAPEILADWERALLEPTRAAAAIGTVSALTAEGVNNLTTQLNNTIREQYTYGYTVSNDGSPGIIARLDRQ